MSSSLPKWLQQVWDEQTEEAFFYFAAWGHMRNKNTNRLTINQMLKLPQQWGEVNKLFDGHPYSFQDAYGSLEIVLSYFQVGNALFRIGFPTMYRRLRDEVEDTELLSFFSMWICLLFVTYFLLTPGKLGTRAVEKCLLLSHNSQYIYREFWEFAAAWNITLPEFKRTEKMNTKRMRERAEVHQRAMEIADLKAASSAIFTKLPKSRQAKSICLALKKLGINTSEKTIIRLLDTRTSV